MKTILSLMALAFGISANAGTNDVLLYQHAPNPDGVPTNWPAKVQPLPEGTPPALRANWLRLSDAELAALKAAARPAFEAWLASRDAAQATVKTNRAQLIVDTISDIELALANWDTLTAAQQKAVLRRVVVIVRAMLKDELR